MQKNLSPFTVAIVTAGLIAAAAFVARAQNPQDLTAPSTVLGYYNRSTATGCPTGWAEFTAARGFYMVGLPNAGTKATAVGAALTDLEARTHTHTLVHTHTLSAHTHTGSGTTTGPSASFTGDTSSPGGHDPSRDDHTHTFSFTTGGPSADTGAASAGSGVQSSAMSPYIQMLVCKKS